MKVFIVTGMEPNYVPNFDLLVYVGPEIKVLKDLASFWQYFGSYLTHLPKSKVIYSHWNLHTKLKLPSEYRTRKTGLYIIWPFFAIFDNLAHLTKPNVLIH